jgi:uncharacterized protein YdeI (BOF family)
MKSMKFKEILSMDNTHSKALIMSGRRFQPGSFVSKFWNRRGAIALLFLPVLLGACGENRPRATAPEKGATVENVAEETQQYIGKTVTVDGEIARQVSPKAFLIQDKEFLGGEDVLVVSATAAPIVPHTFAQVTGTVRQVTNITEVEKEYGFDLEPQLEVELKERPIIVAKTVALKPSLEKITSNPVPFLGRTVTLTGEVERVISPTAFMLDNNEVLGEDDLLVVSAKPANNITEDSRVQVTGTVRKLTTTELDREFNLGPAKEYEVYVQKQPGIVAQTTQVVTQ